MKISPLALATAFALSSTVALAQAGGAAGTGGAGTGGTGSATSGTASPGTATPGTTTGTSGTTTGSTAGNVNTNSPMNPSGNPALPNNVRKSRAVSLTDDAFYNDGQIGPNHRNRPSKKKAPCWSGRGFLRGGEAS
jgi:hypothetical protein